MPVGIFTVVGVLIHSIKLCTECIVIEEKWGIRLEQGARPIGWALAETRYDVGDFGVIVVKGVGAHSKEQVAMDDKGVVFGDFTMEFGGLGYFRFFVRDRGNWGTRLMLRLGLGLGLGLGCGRRWRVILGTGLLFESSEAFPKEAVVFFESLNGLGRGHDVWESRRMT